LGWLAGDNKPDALGNTAIDPARGRALLDWYHSPEARRERALNEARAFLKRQRETERAHYCKHGHYDCSDHDGGRCLDETLNQFPQLEDE